MLAVIGGIALRGDDYRVDDGFVLSFCFNNSVSDRVRTAEVRLDFSNGARLALSHRWSLFGTGAALVGTEADLRASDCFEDNIVQRGVSWRLQPCHGHKRVPL